MPDGKKKTPETTPEETEEKLEETAEKPEEENGTEKPEEEIQADSPEEKEEAEESAEEETEEQPAEEQEASGSEEAEEKPEEPGKGRRFWQKQPSKASKKDKRDELIKELNDKVARQLAEFENFRKRTEKEKLANYTIGARDVLEKILPVLDNFERGLEKADLSDPFAQGMDMVYKQLSTALEELGVTPIEAVGKEFDPNLHNAVMHIDDEAFGENVVAEEFQKGYLYKDQVLRYSMVKVAN